jgi:hypothetical protein
MGAQWKAKHKDLAANARGRVFGKLSKDIMLAARSAAPTRPPTTRLRLVVEQARKVSMPKETLERAVEKGAGLTGEPVNFERVHLRGLCAAPGAGDGGMPDRQRQPHGARDAGAVPKGSTRHGRLGGLGL